MREHYFASILAFLLDGKKIIILKNSTFAPIWVIQFRSRFFYPPTYLPPIQRPINQLKNADVIAQKSSIRFDIAYVGGLLFYALYI